MTGIAARADHARIDIRDGAMMALLGAWLIAFFATVAVLFVGEVMGQMPCVLCWYQRIAMFPLALLLGVAAFRGDLGVWRYALPIATAGLAVAAYHSLLYFGVIPEGIVQCGEGPSCVDSHMEVMGLAIPVLSFAGFLIIAALLLRVRKGERHE